jgi:hypothetical protein
MKKFLLWVVGLGVLFAAAALIFYRFYLPGVVADALTEQETPSYVPKFVEARMNKIKAPLNKGATDVIKEIHKSNVTLEQLLAAVDNTEPEQVRFAFEEINRSKVKNTNDVFDIAKKYVQADFDVEVLRKPFNENVDMSMVKRGLGYLEGHSNDDAMDPEMAKAVIRQVLIQKEKEYRQSMTN